MTDRDGRSVLLDVYRRERLSLLQYVAQASPFAAPADRTVLDRVRGLADAEAETLDQLCEYLDRNRIPLLPPGAFPTAFTNYNFVAVRKLVPKLVEDESLGLAAIERDAAVLPSGEARQWLERLAESKRMHLNELEKMAA